MLRPKREEIWDQLMRAAIAGDAAAYRDLLESLTLSLRAVTRRGSARIGLPAGDVEDVVQETLLAIHLKRHTWQPGEPLAPWVMAIARNKLIDAMRRRGRQIVVPLDTVFESLVADEQASDLDLRDAERMLSGLGEKQRDIVQSISLGGQSIKDVATRLEMTEGAVRVALHRGLKSLAAVYRRTSE